MKKQLLLLSLIALVQQSFAAEEEQMGRFMGNQQVVVTKNKITSDACIVFSTSDKEDTPVSGVNLPQMICFLRATHYLAGAIPHDDVKKLVQGGLVVALKVSHGLHAETAPIEWGSYNFLGQLVLVEGAYQLLNTQGASDSQQEFVSRVALGAGLDVLSYAVSAWRSRKLFPISNDVTSFKIISEGGTSTDPRE